MSDFPSWLIPAWIILAPALAITLSGLFFRDSSASTNERRGVDEGDVYVDGSLAGRPGALAAGRSM